MFTEYKTIHTLSGIFIYGSTLVLFLHIWWGARVVIKYLKLKVNIINYLLEIIMLIILYFILSYINDKEAWALLFSLFFLLALTWYLLLNKLVRKEVFKRYIKKKIRYEVPVIPLFSILYVLLKLFASENMHLILSVATFAIQIFLSVNLFKVKKVYKIVKN